MNFQMPNVLLQDGDFRDADIISIAKALYDKIKRMQVRVHPHVMMNETNYVVLKYLNYQLRLPFTKDDTTDYLLNSCEVFMINKNLELNIPFNNIYVTLNGRPLRRGFNVMEFGVGNFDSLIINVSMLGGYQLYTHIKECEENFSINKCQSGFSTRLDEFTHILEDNSSGISIEFLEDITLLISGVMNSKNWTGVFTSVIGYLRKALKDLGIDYKFYLKQCIEYIKHIFNIKGSVRQSMTQYPLSSIQEIIETYKNFKNTDFAKKIFHMITACISFVLLFEKKSKFKFANLSLLFENHIIKMFLNGSDLFVGILDTILYLVKMGYQCYNEGSLQSIFHSESEYSKWIEETNELKRKSLLLGDPEAHGFTIFEYQSDLFNAIDIGECIAKYANSGEIEKRFLNKQVNDLKIIKNNLVTKREAQKSRQAPFSVMVHGGSSIGKSGFTQILYQYYAKIFDLPSTSEYIYTRNPVDQYWSGFTSVQWCVLLDDIGFLNPNNSAGGDPSLLEMLQVINNVPYCPNQAELENKGRTPLKCKFVIATTNTEDLNAVAYFSCPLAVRRRLPYIIDLAIKQEFSSDGKMLDPTLIGDLDGKIPNFWNITIKKIVPAGDKRAKAEPVEKFDQIEDFLQWFGKTAKHFDEVQNNALKSNSLVAEIKICKTCLRPQYTCDCQDKQSKYIYTSLAYMMICLPLFKYFFLYCYRYSFYRRCVFYIFENSSYRIQHKLFSYIGCFKESINKPRNIFFLTIVANLAVLRIIYTTYAAFIAPRQGGVISTEGEPTPRDKERNNVWWNDSVELTSYDIGRQTLSNKGKYSFIKDMVYKNTVMIQFSYKENGVRQAILYNHALCLKGQLYLINSHAIPHEDDIELTIFQSGHVVGISQTVKFRINGNSIKRDERNDLAILKITSLPPKKSIMELFPKINMTGSAHGFILLRSDFGHEQPRQIQHVSLRQFPVQGFQYEDQFMTGLVEQPTQYGNCGAPYLVDSFYGPMICAIHVSGKDKTAAGIPLSQKIINDFLDKTPYCLGNEVQSGKPEISSDSVKREYTKLHDKSVFRYIDEGTANLHGSFVGFRPNKKSNVVKTSIYNDVVKAGYKDVTDKPVMQGWKPWRLSALEMVKPANYFKSEVLQKCKDAFVRDILRDINMADLKDLMVYTQDVAVNGYPGVAYVDKINRKTSAGCPWKKSKDHFLIPYENELYPYGVCINEEIQKRVIDIEYCYNQGYRYHPIFCGNLKDEPTHVDKIAEGKTRVFTGAPMDWTIVIRKYFLSHLRFIKNNKYAFECAVSTNAMSKEWTDMYKYITKYGEDRIFAGDYSKYDKRMSSTLILTAFDVLIDLAEISGNFSEDQIKTMKYLAYDVAFPNIDYNGDLVEFYGSNPSGHPLTVEINSIVNSLYMRYCYHELNPANEVDTFKQNVSLMTYGDDNIGSVNKKCTFFDHTKIQKILASVDVKYTMADKESESVPFIHINDANFLKRKWRWEDELQAYACPLDESSIHKMLTKVVQSKSVTLEQQSCDNIDCAIREYFWYGKDIFQQKRELLLNIAFKNNLQFCMKSSFAPKWDELCRKFREDSEKSVPDWSVRSGQD